MKTLLLSAILLFTTYLLQAQTEVIGYSAGTTVVCDCPTGYVAVGYRGGSGAWMDRLDIICKKLNADGSLGTTVTYTNSVGATAAEVNGGINSGDIIASGNLALTGVTATENIHTSFGNFLSSIQGIATPISSIANSTTSGTTTLPQFGPTGIALGSYSVPPGSVVTGVEGFTANSGNNYVGGIKLRHMPIMDVTATISIANGNWSDPATWSNHTIPDKNTHVIIASEVTVDINAVCSSVKVQPAARLTVNTGMNLDIKNTTSNKPTADFTFSLDNGNQVPCHASFSNTSANATSYKWYFSNGDSSDNINPQTLYNLPRTYSVKLVATNAAGSDSITKSVTVNPIMKSVVVYLITPRDNQYNPNYYDALKNATTNLQTWYKTQMGNNKTFVLNPLILDTLRGLHDSVWYNSNNGSISGTDPRFYGYFNTLYEMQQLLGNSFNTSDYTYVVYVAAPGGGAGTTGFCAMGDQDLKGLLGQNPDNLDPDRWIGGDGHEMGHAFGLPHPDNQNPEALMWTGYTIYPNCILQQTDKDILNASPFFR